MTESFDLNPDGWEPPRGYAHGMVTKGTMVVLAGQIGWVPQTCTFAPGGFVVQVRQALANIAALLREAGAKPEHLVRLTWFVTSRDRYMESRKEIGAAYRELIGSHYPPMSVVIVSALVEAEAEVEIEATAVIPE
jgi:enamine deaminase RidA (YjgF/YER057c/UK114 family)